MREISTGVLLGVVLSAFVVAPTHQQTPTCLTDCHPLEKPRDGQLVLSSVGCGMDTAVFSCNKGYRLVGSQKRKCNSQQEWSGTAVRCEPDSGTCDDLGDPENGTSTTITQKVYSCLPGYRLVGEEVNTCTTGGYWAHHVPKCLPKKCCDPPEVQGGSHNGTTPGMYKEGDVVGYMCRGNHTRNGQKTIECENGEWTKPPTCDRDCIVGGWSAFSDCEKGTQRRTRIIRHQPVGLGRKCPEVEEIIPCEEACSGCTDPGQIENGVKTGDSYSHGDKVQYRCLDGYILQGPPVLTCQKNDTWDRPKPSCRPCDAKLDIVFVLDESSSVTEGPFNQEVEFVKNFVESYPTKGTQVGLIRYGSNVILDFNLDTHSTQQGMLDALSSIVYSYRGKTNTAGALEKAVTDVFNQGGPARPASEVTRIAVVVTDGKSNIDADTLPNQAANLRGLGVRVIAIGVGAAVDRAELEIIASSPIPSNVFQIADFDQFNSVVENIRNASCGGVTTCADPGQPANSIRSPVSGPFAVGTMVQYTCRDGYYLEGNDVQTCLANGQWLGRHPVCRPECSDPGLIANGDRSGDSFRPGAQLTYVCRPGYVLEGRSVLTCQANITYDYRPPICLPRCTNPGLIVDGTRVGNSYDPGDTLSFTCDSGFVLTGQPVLTCQRNGTYDYPKPTCTRCDTNLDIVFILDESSSVRAAPFLQEVEFVKNFVRSYPSRGTRVGLIRYGSEVFLGFNFNAHSTQQGVLDTLSAVTYANRGRTNTGGALTMAAGDFFGPDGQARPISSNTTRIAVVVTDGLSNVGPAVLLEGAAEELRQLSVRVLAIGIGAGTQRSELELIASSPAAANVFELANFDEFSTILESIRDAACGGADVCADPGLPNFATRVPANPPFPVGTVLRYRCRTGYIIDINSEQTCQANRQWQGGRAVCRTVVDPSGPAVNGGWSVWSAWTGCASTPCGLGQISRRDRDCNDPPQSGAGDPCMGSAAEALECPDPCLP